MMKVKKSGIVLLIIMLVFTMVNFYPNPVAAAVKTPWTDSSVKINVYADLNNLPDGEVVLGEQSTVCIEPKTPTQITADIKNGAFRITSNPKGEHPVAGAMILQLGGNLTADEVSKAQGAGFYFENNLSDGVWIIAAFCFDGVYKRLGDGSQYILVEASNLTGASTASVPNQGQIYIPKGFKGYVLYSLADLKEDFSQAGVGYGMVGLRFGGVVFQKNGSSNMIWDNFFVWGENVTENNTLPTAPKLTNLKLIGAQLDIPFDPDERSYFSYMEATGGSVRVQASAQEGITLKCNGKALISGQESSPINLNTGSTDIVIEAINTQGAVSKTVITVIKTDPEQQYNEPFRPQFHFTPYMFSLNDPNGLIYNSVTGQYHLYFQCDRPIRNNFAVDGNKKSWGHAVSYDLVNWQEMPLAIMPDENGTIWSGSAVIDKNNTSGFFDDATAPEARMVALYTYYGGTKPTNGLCSVGIAYSKDNGTTWIKPYTDPIIPNTNNMYMQGMRDPKVVWYADDSYANGGIWMMIVAGGRAQIFTSPDLINWTRDRELFCKNGTQLDSECPELFPIALDGDPSNIKWVYSGGGVFYIIGDVVKKEDGKLDFIAETDKITPVNGVSELFPGSGKYSEMYATQGFFNDPKGRRIEISWMRDLVSTSNKPWYNVESLALEVKLVTVNGKMRLTKYPVEELKTLRSAEPVYQADNIKITPDSENILKDLEESLFDIEATFTPDTAEEFGFNLRMKDNSYLTVKYDAKNNRLITDKDHISNLINGVYSTKMAPSADGKVTLRIIVDASVIDVFGNNGEVFHNGLTFAPQANKGMELFATGGSVTLDSIRIYRMSPMNRTAVSGKEQPTNSVSPAPQATEPAKNPGKSKLGFIMVLSAAGVALLCVAGAVIAVKKKKK